MKLTFLTIGKPRSAWVKEALNHYESFLSKYADASFEFLKTASPALSPREIIAIESERVFESLAHESGYKIVCDKSGTSFTSESFAKKFQKGIDAHGGRAIIVVGGAWGLEDRALKVAHLLWSFGPMTFPHELALIIAAEQTARALSILRGNKYHK